jgi:poly(A) polymerase
MCHPEGDVWQHTMKMLSMLESGCSLTLALATLLHDVGKPVTAKTNEKTGHNQFHGHEHVGARMAERLLRDFRFSNEVVGTVSSLVENHMRFFNTEKMSLSKMKRFVRMENFSELLELNRVDSLGSNGDLTANNFCRGFRDNMKDELHPVRLLTGNDLLAMGFKAGPVFKTLLEAVETAQLEGVVTTREEAVALVTASSGKV